MSDFAANNNETPDAEDARVVDLAQEAATLAKENAELKDRVLRTLAEMENLRRRTEREVADSRVYAIQSFARDLVGVADNIQRALDAVRDSGWRSRDRPRRWSTASSSPSASCSKSSKRTG